MSKGETRRALGGVRKALLELARVRWVRIVLILVAIALGLRLALNSILASTLNSLASSRDLVCEWDDLDLSIIDGRAELHLLRLAPAHAEGVLAPEALMEIEYAVFDLQILPLLLGDLRVQRAEVDGLDARVQRDESGVWNLERHVAVAEVLALFQSSGEEPTPEAENELQPLDLSLPLAVNALRFQSARIHLVDRSPPEPLELSLELNAALSHLNTSDRPARFSLALTGSDLLDGATIVGELQAHAESLQITAETYVGGLQPRVLTDYLDLLHLRPAAETLEASCHLDARLDVVGELGRGLSVAATLANVHVSADEEECFALDELVFDAARLASDRADIGLLELRGPAGRIELLADGALRAAGLDLVPTVGPRIDATADPAGLAPTPPADFLQLLIPGEAPPWATLFVHEGGEAFPWSLAGLSVSEGQLLIADHRTSPTTELALEEIAIGVSEIVHDPAVEPDSISIAVRCSAPGITESIAADAALNPFAPARSMELTFGIEGIGLDALEAYLDRAGLEAAGERGSFRLQLSAGAHTSNDGVTTAQVELREVALDGHSDLFGLRALGVRDVRLDPERRVIRVGEVALEGMDLFLEREPSRQLLGFGLRLLGQGSSGGEVSSDPATVTESEVSESAPAVAPAGLAPPRIILDRVIWSGTDVSFLDRTVEPPSEVVLDDFGFELNGLVLGGLPGDPEPQPATLRGRFAAPGIVDSLTVEGTVRSLPGPLDLQTRVALRGDGIRGGALTPYMQELGIDPVLNSGRLRADLSAGIRSEDAGVHADITLADVLFEDGEQPLLALERLELAGLVAGGEGLSVKSVSILNPQAHLSKDAQDRFGAAGMRFVPAPSAEGELDVAPADVPGPQALELPSLPRLTLGEVHVEGGAVTYADESLDPALEVGLGFGVSAQNINTLGQAGSYQLSLSVPDSLESLSVQGALTLGAEAIQLSGTLAGRGLREGDLKRFLPPGVSLEAVQAELGAGFTASVSPAGDGGLAGRLDLHDATWGLPESNPWLSARRIALDATRIDLVGGVLEFGEVIVEGATLDVKRDSGGSLHALGARIDGGRATVANEPQGQEQSTESEMETGPPAPGPTSTVAPPSIRFAQGISLELERFTFADATLGEQARPIVGSARLELAPATVVNHEPADLPPMEWSAQGQVEGVVETWSWSSTVAPFAAEPRLTGRFLADGVHTTGLPEFFPDLAEVLQGELDTGRLEFGLDATLYVRRARPFESGLGRPFSADARVEGLYFRDGPEGDILLGIDAVDVAVKRVDTGGGLLHIDSIEVDTPHFIAERDGEGLHVLGFALPIAAPVQEDADGPTAEHTVGPEAPRVQATEVSEPTPQPPGPAAPTAEPSTRPAELRIDRFTVSGLNVDLRDDSVEPPVRVVLNELDSEVRRFTTRAFTEKKPVLFSAFLGSSPSADSAPVFEEVVASGRVTLFPEPDGWARIQLAGMELPPFSGLAATAGLGVNDGALDSDVRLRLRGDDGVSVDMSIVFSDLDLEEPEGGVVESTFSMPMALDSALFLLRNPSGEHRFSLGLTLDKDGVSAGDLALAATGAMTEVLAVALAGAPLRLLLALGPQSESKGRVRDEVSVVFYPGATVLADRDRKMLNKLSTRLAERPKMIARVTYDLGSADLAQAEQLANPSERDCHQLTRDLRRRKGILSRRVEEGMLEARALYAIGSSQAGVATRNLRTLEAELARVEHSLDQVLDVLRSGSPRQRHKRTRNVAREQGELRLAAVLQALELRLRGSDLERIESRRVRIGEPSEHPQSRVHIEFLRR